MANTSVIVPENTAIFPFIGSKKCSGMFKNLFNMRNNTVTTSKEIIYRRNGITVDKVIETDSKTNQIVKITHYNYFNDKKISSVEEYKNGIKTKETNFNFFKIVTEYNDNGEKKIRTTNYDLKTGTKIISVYDYDADTGIIVRMSVYRPDGKTVAFIKEFSPKTGMVTRCINYRKDSNAISSVSQYKLSGDTCIRTTYYYKTPLYILSDTQLENKITADNLNERILCNNIPQNMSKLIDNLYKKCGTQNILKIS